MLYVSGLGILVYYECSASQNHLVQSKIFILCVYIKLILPERALLHMVFNVRSSGTHLAIIQLTSLFNDSPSTRSSKRLEVNIQFIIGDFFPPLQM
jgi:hypothetical protein